MLVGRYEYSHTTDRLWRKNRRPSRSTLGLCPGVDLNRNFGYKWAHELSIFAPRPASPIPCLDTFHGNTPFSEPETRAVRDFVMSKRHRLEAYLAFHSFGNRILYPWGYTSRETNDVEDLKTFAQVAKDAIENNFAESRFLSDVLQAEPSLMSYSVAQQSLRESLPEKEPPATIRNSLSRFFLGLEINDKISQTDTVR